MGLGHSPRIVTENLVLALDAGNPKNYNAGISTNWMDKVGGNNGTLVNGTYHNDGPFVGAGYVEFDGTGDYLQAPLSLNPNTSNFTIECFIYLDTAANEKFIVGALDWFWFSCSYTGGSSGVTSGKFGLSMRDSANSNWYSVSSTTSFASGRWYHVAATWDGTYQRMFVDGVLEATSVDRSAITWASKTTNVDIGGYSTNTSFTIDGFISNLRIIVGTALYTSNFTPPTGPLTAVTNTVLLTCQGNSISPGTDIVVTTSNKGSGSVGSLSAVTSSGNYYFDNRSASPSTASIQLDFKTVQTGVTQIKLSGGSYALGSTFDLYVNGVLVEDDRSVVSAWGEDTITISSTNISSIKIEGSDGYSLGALKFNGTLVSGTIAEIVPNGNAAARLGFPASAFELDGTDDCVDVTNNANLYPGTGDFTAEVWCRGETAASAYYYLLSNYGNSGANYYGWYIHTQSNGSGIVAGMQSGSGATGVTISNTTVNLNDSNWHHVVFVRSGNAIRLYHNGEQLESDGDVTGYNVTSLEAKFRIGKVRDPADPNGGVFFWNGKISGVKIYKGKGLTAEEVQQNYNALKGRYV